MNALALISRIVGPLVARATEGAFRRGPYQLPVSGGWLPDGAPLNWWQCGYLPYGGTSRSAMVEACVSAYAQTIAMCAGDHWRATNKGGRERVKTSALSRILRHPNSYQSISDFMLNATRSLYLDGNAYALALRNDRFEIDSLHLMDPRQSHPLVAETGDVFYYLGGNHVIAQQLSPQGTRLVVPQRDVLHVRLHSLERQYPFPLVGETPLTAAMGEIAMGDAIINQQLQFYLNQARPSAVLSTDLPLKRPQVDELRDLWNIQAKGLDGCGPGGIPILTHGLKVQPWSTPGKDAQIAEVMKYSDERIALAYRVPLQVLGIGGTPYSSTELMMAGWIATGLGFALNHIEEAFGLTFALKGQPDEYCEFSTDPLLRSAFKDRMEALSKGVLGGIYAPNEAREREGLDAAKFGDEPRLQAQVIPLSAANQISSAPSAPAAPAPNAPAPPPKDYHDHVRRHAHSVISSASRFDRIGAP